MIHQKSAAEYYKCGVCGFIFTSLCDDWQSESFSKYIYNDDYIKVDGEYKEVRPARLAAEMTDLFVRLKDKRILDYGFGCLFCDGNAKIRIFHN